MKYIFLIIVAIFLLAGCSIINTQEIPPEAKPNNVETDSNTSTKDKLDLSGQGLQQVSQSVFEQTNLRELNVSNNQLTGLPNELGNLQKLKTLNLSGNQVSEQDLNGIRQNLPAGVNIIK